MMMPSFGKVSGADRMSPMPRITRGRGIETDRDVGAGRAGDGDEMRIVEGEPVRLGEQPQRRRGIGRAAAEPGAGR